MTEITNYLGLEHLYSYKTWSLQFTYSCAFNPATLVVTPPPPPIPPTIDEDTQNCQTIFVCVHNFVIYHGPIMICPFTCIIFKTQPIVTGVDGVRIRYTYNYGRSNIFFYSILLHQLLSLLSNIMYWLVLLFGLLQNSSRKSWPAPQTRNKQRHLANTY